MSVKWVKGEAMITLFGGFEQRVVSCERLEPDVGLFINRNPSGKGWHITHAPSGLALRHWRTLTTARKVVVAIKDITDWTTPKESLLAKQQEIRAQFEAKVAEVEAA